MDNEWTEGWTDRWKGGWMDGPDMNGWMDGTMAECRDGERRLEK